MSLSAAANAGLLHPHRPAERVLQLQQDQQHRPQHGVSRQLQATFPGTFTFIYLPPGLCSHVFQLRFLAVCSVGCSMVKLKGGTHVTATLMVVVLILDLIQMCKG